jgi:hypothetical protein
MRLLLVVLAACHPYLSGGVEMGSHASGPLAGMMSAPVASARTDSTVAAAPTTPHTYSLALGFGGRDFGFEAGLHANQVSGESLMMPSGSDSYLASPRYLATTASLDFRWTWLRVRGLSTYIHFGPTTGCVLDKSDGSTTWGEGVRYGAGIAYELPVVRLFVDASRTDLSLSTGPGAGMSSMQGVLLGLALH